MEITLSKGSILDGIQQNYAFLPRSTQALMHPRTPRTAWPKARMAQAQAVLAFVQERGAIHPREVDAHYAQGRVRNWFGGSTNARTQLLDGMHFRGQLRIAARVGGVRMYSGVVAAAAHLPQTCADEAEAMKALDALVDVIVHKYAPLPERSLRELINMLRGGAPQWEAGRPALR
jgi:uncharacterized protein